MIFCQVEGKKIEVKDTRGHFKFSYEYVRYYAVSAVVITLLDFQNLYMTSLITSSDIFYSNDPALIKLTAKKNDFFNFLLETAQKK